MLSSSLENRLHLIQIMSTAKSQILTELLPERIQAMFQAATYRFFFLILFKSIACNECRRDKQNKKIQENTLKCFPACCFE